ncbi:5-azacytidine resistance protein azr1 [Peziza echinospora]|nr:5-azacytidine resistance protein azr1 [Peziza echinospora]
MNTDTVSNKNLSFQVSAAYSAKGDHFEPASHTFNFNPYNRVSVGGDAATKKKSRPKTGQDAFFVSRLNDSGGVAVGVADGVGGYSHYGIDSADFSHTLCENMATLAHNSPSGKLHPRTLLHNAYQRLLEEENGVRGGASTACVGTIRPGGVLTVANLGDSGYIILRGGRVLYMSASQTHAFNTPYQLSVVPPEVLDQSRMFGGDFLCDLPKDAQVSTHNLENGDVVIFATDGVWDNLFTQDILKIVSQEMIGSNAWSSGVVAEKEHAVSAAEDSGYELASHLDGTGLQSSIARAVAAKAKSASQNRRVDGPFAKEVKRLMKGEIFAGGKRDDICVVCLVVVDKEKAPEKGGAAASTATAAVGGSKSLKA